MKIQFMKLKINLIVLYINILQKPLYILVFSVLIGLALRLFCWKVLLFCDEPSVRRNHELDLSTGQETIEVLSKSEQVYVKRDISKHALDLPTGQETIKVLSKSEQVYLKYEISKPVYVPPRVDQEILRLPKLPKLPEVPQISDDEYQQQQTVFTILDIFDQVNLSNYPTESHRKLANIGLAQAVLQDDFPTQDDIKKLINNIRTSLDLSDSNNKIKLRTVVASIMTADSARATKFTDPTQLLLLYDMFDLQFRIRI